jgi:hypothetical protein
LRQGTPQARRSLPNPEKNRPRTGECQVKIEVLYVAECPSHPAAVKLVKNVLSQEGVSAEVSEVLVSDESLATDLRFQGSPTVRVNGRDVAGESSRKETFALSCRLYAESNQVGLPPVELVRRAVLEAGREDQK